MNKTLTMFGAAAAAAVMGMAGAANATTMTQVQTYSGIPNYTVPLNFNYFNTAWGTLNSVTVEVSLNTTGGFGIVDNDGVDPATVTIDTVIAATATSGGVFLPAGTTAGTSVSDTFNLASENAGPDGAAIDGSAPDGGTLSVPVGTYSSGVITASPLQVNTFIGTGTYTISLAASQATNITVGGGVATGNNPASTDGFVRIIYDFTPVPEPASLGLLAVGGLMMIRRRRDR